MHLLVVENDPSLADLLRKGFTAERHVVDVVNTGEEGLERGESGAYDAVVLDLGLPDIDGIDVTRTLRSEDDSLPILIVTARDSLTDRLLGFDAGADDYITKPFAFQELLARLHASTRRGGPSHAHDRLVLGDLVMDRRTHEVTRGGRSIELSHREYALLEYLMMHPNQVLSRTMILEHVWDYAFEPSGNVVDVTVARLRKAIDEGHSRRLIRTVRGVGYKIKA